jgi:bacterioferritin-associated ferredoxin
MASSRTRVSRISNRHAPYRETEAFAAAAMSVWRAAIRRTVLQPLLPRRVEREAAPARSDDMYVCSCKSITESQVRCLRMAGASPASVARSLGLDDPECCGRCLRNIDRIVMLIDEPVGMARPVAVLSR